MSALLLYSHRCQHSIEAVNIIKKNKVFNGLIILHDVNTKPIPQQLRPKVTHVPTIITKDGKVMAGGEVLTWLRSMIPSDFSGVDYSVGTNLDGSEMSGGYFDMDSYGASLKPELTTELKNKIDMDVSEAYNVRNNK